VAPLTWIQWHIAVERSREDGHWRTYANDNQLSHRQRSTGPPEHQRAYPGSAERSACQTETVHPGSSPRLRAAVRGRTGFDTVARLGPTLQLENVLCLLRPGQCPALTQAEPVGGLTALPIPIPFNLSRRRLCNPLGRSLGCAAHRCAISVARARAALTATLPRSIRSSARRTIIGAPKSRSLVNFMIRPPAFGLRPEPHPTTRITPPDRGLLMTVPVRDLGAGTSIPSRHKEVREPDQIAIATRILIARSSE
jgi:hypothetical protein